MVREIVTAQVAPTVNFSIRPAIIADYEQRGVFSEIRPANAYRRWTAGAFLYQLTRSQLESLVSDADLRLQALAGGGTKKSFAALRRNLMAALERFDTQFSCTTVIQFPTVLAKIAEQETCPTRDVSNVVAFRQCHGQRQGRAEQKTRLHTEAEVIDVLNRATKDLHTAATIALRMVNLSRQRLGMTDL